MKNRLLILSFILFCQTFNCIALENQLKPTVRDSKSPPVLNKDYQEYRISGKDAAMFAMSQGYYFFPDKKTHNLGSTSMMANVYFESNSNQNVGSSQILYGSNMVVGKCHKLPSSGSQDPVTCWNYFHLFKGKKLNRKWRIKNVEGSNIAQWAKKPNVNTDRPYIKVKVLKPADRVEPVIASINWITLIGPKNTKWKEAFKQ